MKTKNEQLNEQMESLAKTLAPQYKGEIEAVKALGERIGYGNMMSIASTLWALSLNEQYGVTSGAFFPTITGFMKKREANRAEKEQKRRMESFKRMGF